MHFSFNTIFKKTYYSLKCLYIILSLLTLTTVVTSAFAEDYRIGAEDLLQTNVYEQPDLSSVLKVGSDGNISFPLLGRIKAEGFTVTELEMELEKKLSDGFLVNPQVSILIKEYRSRKIYVLGGVGKPGIYELRKSITLLEAISRAGGLVSDAAQHAIITRSKTDFGNPTPDKEPIRIDLKRLLDEGDTQLNINVNDGDVIQIPNPNTYFVFGEIKNPGSYTLEKDVTILQAITRAGGFTKIAAPARTKVIRGKAGEERTIKVDISSIIKGDKNKDIPLVADDIVIVPESFF